MAKVAKYNPDGSYYGLVDREEPPVDERAAQRPPSGSTADPGTTPNSHPSEPASAVEGDSDGLEDLTVKQLQAKAADLGLADYSQLRKAELVAAVRGASG